MHQRIYGMEEDLPQRRHDECIVAEWFATTINCPVGWSVVPWWFEDNDCPEFHVVELDHIRFMANCDLAFPAEHHKFEILVIEWDAFLHGDFANIREEIERRLEDAIGGQF